MRQKQDRPAPACWNHSIDRGHPTSPGRLPAPHPEAAGGRFRPKEELTARHAVWSRPGFGCLKAGRLAST